jgi:septal ring-binding cell division protein DamX
MQSPAVEVETTDTVEAEISSPPESDSESEQIAQSSEMPDTTPTIEVVILEPVEMQETESPVELEQDNPPVPEQTEAETEAAEEAPPPEPEPIVEAESPPGLEPNVETEPDAVTGLPVEPGPTEQSIAETTLLEDLLADNTTQYSSRFQHELANSLDWIEQNDKGRATIQLMLLGFAEFTENTYYDYIDRLKRRDIDLSRIKIYPTVINDIVVYGVIYGEYENRVEAKRQIQNLPEALEADRPIPRTFGGIWSEITQQ